MNQLKPVPPDVADSLARLGRLCSLLNIQLSQGTPPVGLQHALRDLASVIERIRPTIDDLDPLTWVQVDTRIGDATGHLIADALNPGGVPDRIPDDLLDDQGGS